MTKSQIRFIQRVLIDQGFDPGPEDGIAGQKTMSALSQVVGINTALSKRRRLIQFIQLQAKSRGIQAGEIDGYWGPQTDYAFGALQQKIETGNPPAVWRPEEIQVENPNNWPPQQDEDVLMDFYGPPGNYSLTMIQLPYLHRLAWKPGTVIQRFQCHEKVHDSLKRVLMRVLDHYGTEGIRSLRLDMWGGCYNNRKMRGGSKPSMHSWGIALDYDPSNNKLKWGRDRATFARPEYDAWWNFWEEEGWFSLGRHKNFDWMHVQAARL